MKEEWRNIKGFEGLYEVSNEGNVRSLNYNRTGKAQNLKFGVNKDGYLYVVLSKEGKYKTYQVHRLVATMFIPNPNNLPQVNHIDENKQNNNVSNLEWCDCKYNNNYGSRPERLRKANKGNTNMLGKHHTEETKTKISNANSKKVLCIELNKEFNSLTEAAEYINSSIGTISLAIKNKGKAKGYTFKLIE